MRDPAHPPDPAENTPGGHPKASHSVMAVAELSAPAARDERTWAFACPILSPGSIAVTGIWADSGASVERGGGRRGAGYAQQAPSAS